MEKIKAFIKKEVVLCVATVLAILSALWIRPDKQYLSYIDFHTLAILFCLMCVMAGFRHIGMFRWVAGKLLSKVHRVSGIVLLLVLLCFFFSMLITNDVALITFVPFSFVVGKMLGKETYKRMVMPTVVLQTIAANLGSMLTPIGNPQNLYLYGILDASLIDFIRIMLPYSLVSLVLLILCSLVLGKWLERKEDAGAADSRTDETLADSGKPGDRPVALIIYLMLFGMCLLTVAQILPVWITLIASLIGIVITEYRELAHIDYGLLLTFVAFFIFIGNMGRIPEFADLLQSLIAGNEVMVSVVASQCISNVPAALLLSGFTTDITALLIGTNLGGLGTLIASMASLISYKYMAAECEESKLPGGKGRYFAQFTISNICFLLVLVLLYFCIR